MKYIPRRFEGRHFLSGSVTQGKASKKLFVTSASDPAATDDTGLGYAAGTTWVNTTSGQVFICTSDSAEDATWRGQEGDDVNHSPAWQGLTYAYELGGATPGPTAMSDKISRWPVAAPYPTADVGELAQGIAGMASYVGPGNVGFTAGGYSNPGDTHYAEVTSFPTAGPPVSTSNQGDLARGVWAYGSSGWSPTEGYTLGGQEAPATRYVNTIDNSEQVIFFSIHQSNWEILVPVIDQLGISVGAIYRHINNKYIDKLVLKKRNQSINSKRSFYTPKGKESAKELIFAINNNSSIILLVDQKDTAGDSVKLFNIITKTQTGFLKIARKHNLKLIPIQNTRYNNNNFLITFYPPIKPFNKNKSDAEAMLDIHKIIEKWILENPTQWFWQHNRFN